jgi:hypothetical protein
MQKEQRTMAAVEPVSKKQKKQKRKSVRRWEMILSGIKTCEENGKEDKIPELNSVRRE